MWYFSLANLRQCQPFPLAGLAGGFSFAANAGAAREMMSKLANATLVMTAPVSCDVHAKITREQRQRDRNSSIGYMSSAPQPSRDWQK